MASASDVKKRAKVAREIYESEKYYLGTLLDIKKVGLRELIKHGSAYACLAVHHSVE